MAKPKAPEWLREAFRDGVDEYTRAEHTGIGKPYPLANPWCWLARFDPARRPCAGVLERFHYVRRQDVENAMWSQLANAIYEDAEGLIQNAWDWDLILVAAWDARNGGMGCEEHHRRYDGHQVSLPRERVIVPFSALPARVIHFGFDYSEGRLLDRFPASI